MNLVTHAVLGMFASRLRYLVSFNPSRWPTLVYMVGRARDDKRFCEAAFGHGHAVTRCVDYLHSFLVWCFWPSTLPRNRRLGRSIYSRCRRMYSMPCFFPTETYTAQIVPHNVFVLCHHCTSTVNMHIYRNCHYYLSWWIISKHYYWNRYTKLYTL